MASFASPLRARSRERYGWGADLAGRVTGRHLLRLALRHRFRILLPCQERPTTPKPSPAARLLLRHGRPPGRGRADPLPEPVTWRGSWRARNGRRYRIEACEGHHPSPDESRGPTASCRGRSSRRADMQPCSRTRAADGRWMPEVERPRGRIRWASFVGPRRARLSSWFRESRRARCSAQAFVAGPRRVGVPGGGRGSSLAGDAGPPLARSESQPRDQPQRTMLRRACVTGRRGSRAGGRMVTSG
jgi:hypothetical protein